MNLAQKAVYNEVPVSYRPTFERAFTTNSKSAGIKAFCLRCVGYLRNEVRECTARGCPLWTHRPYQADTEADE